MDYLAADIPVGAGQLAGQAIPIKVRAVEKSQKIRPASDKHPSPHHQKKCFSFGDLPRILVV
uniref:hypothetical protein n=1 Tax=Algoriphagus sp. TaxID=1872435 RepID=UPI004047A3AF